MKAFVHLRIHYSINGQPAKMARQTLKPSARYWPPTSAHARIRHPRLRCSKSGGADRSRLHDADRKRILFYTTNSAVLDQLAVREVTFMSAQYQKLYANGKCCRLRPRRQRAGPSLHLGCHGRPRHPVRPGNSTDILEQGGDWRWRASQTHAVFCQSFPTNIKPLLYLFSLVGRTFMAWFATGRCCLH